ncbi:MAG: glycoside hydrolase family 13 protein [Lachnospiraceae bacterium]|nr:glycoside hydrolase family 13 protein [Lachnospiraceae bacterium]
MLMTSSFVDIMNIQRQMQYIFQAKPAINMPAIFSDGTEFYRSPAQPTAADDIRVRIRTATSNVDMVFVIVNGQRVDMELEKSDKAFDYFVAVLPHSDQGKYEYFFEIHGGRVVCYYNKLGVVRDLNPDYNFEICCDFFTPEWARGAVIYQIFVDRFANGDLTNDVKDNEYYYLGSGSRNVKDWGAYPESMDVSRFYGGDLLGVWNKLDYLQELGVDVIYFNPLFVSPSNHKYDIQDYDYIDPHYGRIVVDEGECLKDGDTVNKHSERYISRVTDKRNLEASNKFFADLVAEIHRRGMKVILDGVFNHCGSFNKWLDKECIYEGQEGYQPGAYVSADSPYRSFFRFHNEYEWPYNNSYDGWWGHDTLPKLNYEDSPKLYEYIMRIARKWVSPPYNCDGWRLDVAADLGYSAEFNHRFWKDFRKNVKEANPNAIVLAEHYGDPKEWLRGDEWDTVMNYDAFMEPITWFLTGVEKHSDEFRGDLLGNPDAFFGAIRHHMSRFHQQSLEISMNELSNHDHSRFLTRTNRRVGRTHTLGPHAAEENVNKGVFREAVVFQMTWPGAPTIYYGDEAGLCGWTDPDNRRTYPWGHEDQELIAFHRDIIKIHKSYDALMRGSVRKLYGDHKIICYGRFTDRQRVVVIINSNYEEKGIAIPVAIIGVPNGGFMRQIMLTTEDGYFMEQRNHLVKDDMLKIQVPKISAMVLVEED